MVAVAGRSQRPICRLGLSILLDALVVRVNPHSVLHQPFFALPLMHELMQGRRGRPLACIGFTSAPRHLAPNDGFIGCSPQVRGDRRTRSPTGAAASAKA